PIDRELRNSPFCRGKSFCSLPGVAPRAHPERCELGPGEPGYPNRSASCRQLEPIAQELPCPCPLPGDAERGAEVDLRLCVVHRRCGARQDGHCLLEELE